MTEKSDPPETGLLGNFDRLGNHEHVDCGHRERVWLPKEVRAEATLARHPFCVECGTVKNLSLPRGRPIGHYLSGLAGLRAYLERSSDHAKLAQVQSHLIAGRMLARKEFEDPYGTPGEAQLSAYVDIVRSVRPELEQELILKLLPGRRGGNHRCRTCLSTSKYHPDRHP